MDGRIVIERTSTGYADRLRAYKVAVDGEVVGEIRRGETQAFEVPAGQQRVQLHIDWCRSQPVDVEVRAGKEVHLRCHPRNPLLAFYWITFGRNRYVVLEPA